MGTGRSGVVERSTVVLAACVAGVLIVTSGLGISGWGVRALRWLVLDGPLEAALLFAWVVLVLIRNPYPGFDPVVGRLSRSRHRRTLLTGIRAVSLLLVVLLLGAGLGLRTVLTQVPGLQILLVVAIALSCVAIVARRRPVSDVSRIELTASVPFTFGLAAELLTSGGPGITTFDWMIAGAGAIAVAAGVAITIGLPIRPPTPFDDPLKLILGGGATVMAAAVPTMSMTVTPVLALLVMPTIVAVVELAILTQSGTVGGRSGGVPVLEVLREPADRVERDLRRIKGTFRRTRSRELIDSGELPVPEMMTHDLAEHLKLALQMEVSSQARGGEDLPNLLDGEVEIARITYTQTVHGEVVSLRAIRSGDDRLALRLVDEAGSEFVLPFDEVRGEISAEQVAAVFCTSQPAPTDVGAFSVLSDVIPDLHTAFGRAFEIGDTMTAPRGIGAAIRGYFALTTMGAVAATRKALNFQGLSISYEARFYGFGVVVTRSIVNTFVPDVSLLLWALWIPVPALAVRRIRMIGLDTIKTDAPRLALGAGGAGVLGAIILDLPIWFGIVTLSPTILMLYLMFRQGPAEHAILSPESTPQW